MTSAAVFNHLRTRLATLGQSSRRELAFFLKNVLAVFQVPFAGLAVVLWFYFVLCHIFLPYNPVWLGVFPDPDDFTYLTHTLDWLQGQSWFDIVQHRMDPPNGVAIHYTRFAELPIAVVILFFRSFGYSWHGAARLGAYLLPLIYLAFFFGTLRLASERFVSKGWARLSCYVALCSSFLMYKFMPSQIDHHGLECILTLGAIALTVKTFERPGQFYWALAASGLFALTLTIALEVLPWVALSAGIFALWSVALGKKARRAAVAFGFGLFAFSVLFLFLTRGPDDWGQMDLLSYSVVYVLLLSGAALSLFVSALVSPLRSFKGRFLILTVVSASLGVLFLREFPALMQGPYGAMDAKLASVFFANITEALPMPRVYSSFRVFCKIFLSAFGFFVCIGFLIRARDSDRWKWLLLGSLLATAIGLSVFYQARVAIYAHLFSIIPLVAFAEKAWGWLDVHAKGRSRFWGEIGIVLLIGPLSGVLLPALTDFRSFSVGVLMFPADRIDTTCDIREVVRLLNAPPYSDRKRRIMNMMGQGAELLFETPHDVMAAPYHKNVHGNLEAINFFTSSDTRESEKIARRNDIDLVVVCHSVPDMYLSGTGPHYYSLPNGLARILPNDSLVGHISGGKTPEWLKEIPLKGASNYSVYEVVKKKLKR